VQSATAVSTTSGTPVDDTQAVLSLSLARDSDVLIMYVGGNPYGAAEDYDGKGVQLLIDGADKSNSVSWQVNGGYCQNLGNWYDLPGLSTVYVTVTVSATSSGTSHVYAYLEVRIPNTSIYNFMIIAFQIS
jgi:hypothetical protein